MSEGGGKKKKRREGVREGEEEEGRRGEDRSQLQDSYSLSIELLQL